MSAFTEPTYYLYGPWRYIALLVICEKFDQYVDETNRCGHVKLIVKANTLNSQLKGVSIEHFCKMKIKYN